MNAAAVCQPDPGLAPRQPCDYPLHLGVTEAGPAPQGTVKLNDHLKLHGGLRLNDSGNIRILVLTSFLHSVARASEPELTLLLVHSRTPLAPLDTVRALSPGRGRQSSAQGFTFSTAGGDTSPGNLPHLNRSHSFGWLAATASLAREKSPGLPPQIVAASHPKILSRPLPQPPASFPRPPNFVRGRGKDAHYEPFSRYKGRAEKNWRG